MSFFIRNKRKLRPDSKKKINGTDESKKAPKAVKKTVDDEEIPSDSDIDSDEVGGRDGGWSSEEDQETAQEKRLRLAKEYLAQLETEKEDDGREGTYGSISQTLKDELLEQKGKLHKEVANTYAPPDAVGVCICRGHQLSVTCLVITPDNSHVISAGKDCSIIKWCVATGKKVKVIPGGRKGTEEKHIGHTEHVLCLAISSDNKFLVSGDRNKLIHVWNPDTLERLHTLTGHRDAVASLAFRRGTHQLFSASHDRTIKTWNLDEMAYVETLFGHQDSITCLDSLSQDRAVSCGGRDGSVRLWKIIDESQLVFHGHSGSIDCVAFIDENHFISGADDNSLALWGTMKKKPLVTVSPAHPSHLASTVQPWITAVSAFTHTDLVASGSHDGAVRLWRCGADFKSLTPLFSILLAGFVNGLSFSSDGRQLVAAVGQEHRLGRWSKVKEAKNAICIFTLGHRTPEEIEELAKARKSESSTGRDQRKKPFRKNTKKVTGKMRRGMKGKRML